MMGLMSSALNYWSRRHAARNRPTCEFELPTQDPLENEISYCDHIRNYVNRLPAYSSFSTSTSILPESIASHVNPTTFGCAMQHQLDCDLPSCTVGNCDATCQLIIHDYITNKIQGRYPRVPMHPEHPLGDPMMSYLDPGQAANFFIADASQKAILKVDEFCLLSASKNMWGPNVLAWTHRYIIERYGKMCYVLQSDQRKYHIGHLLRGSQAFPRHLRNYVELMRLKERFQYDGLSSGGVDCILLMGSYVGSYPEISAFAQYKQTCLEYYALKANHEAARNESFAHNDEAGLAQTKKRDKKHYEKWGKNQRSRPSVPVPDLGVGRLSEFAACGDNKPIPWRFKDGRYELLQIDDARLLQTFMPGSSLRLERLGLTQDVFTERQVSMAGTPGKCTAVASTPLLESLRKEEEEKV